MKRFLAAIMALFIVGVVGCGSSDEFNINSFTGNTGGSTLSGQTGTVTVQTQLAANQISGQEVLVVESTIIPSFVDELRFTGQDANGAFIYGPVILPKAATLNLENVPVEVTTLRIELLVNGFTVGGLVTPVNVPSGETVFITNPVYVFAGTASDVDTATVYGLFRSTGTGGEVPFPEGEFPIDEAPVFDFDFVQVSNGVTRTSPGFYTVTEDGDYLLTYSLEIPGFFSYLMTQISVDQIFVANTRLDIADLENFFFIPLQTTTGLQSFQHIVSLQAGDQVALRVRDFEESGEIQGQALDIPTFFLPQGNFSIVRLGEGGTIGVAPPDPENNDF